MSKTQATKMEKNENERNTLPWSQEKVRCPRCPKKIMRGFLSEHVKTMHDGRTYLCSLCNIQKIQTQHWKEHNSQKHNSQAKATIFYDDVRFRKTRNTSSSLCKACGLASTNSQSKRHHFAEVHRGRTFQCNSCAETFRSHDKLGLHNDECHEGKATFSAKYNWITFCKYCQKGFHHATAKSEHVQVCHLGRIFTCDTCGEQMAKNMEKYSHMKIHGGWTTFTKTYKTGDKSAKTVITVITAKTAKTKLRCQLCDRSFANQTGLSIHCKRIHKTAFKVVYQCNICARKLGKLFLRLP